MDQSEEDIRHMSLYSLGDRLLGAVSAASFGDLGLRGGGMTRAFSLIAAALLCVCFLAAAEAGGQTHPAVANFKASPVPQGFNLTWDKPSAEAIMQYVVKWKRSRDVNYPSINTRNINDGNATSYTLYGLDDRENHDVFIYYVVSPPNQLPQYSVGAYLYNIKPKPARPAQVTGVSVTPGVGKLTVGWSAASGATGYKVQWKSGAQNYLPGATGREKIVSGGNTTTSSITGLTAGTEYTVRVVSTKTGTDDGDPSAEKTGVPKAVTPGQVTGVAAAAPDRGASNRGKLDVSWTAISGATGFDIGWRKSGGSWSAPKSVSGADATAGTIAGLEDGVTYTVRVRATNEHADATAGPWSDEATGTTNAGPPGKATIDSVTAGVGTLSVSWGFVSDVTGYKVQWKSGTQNWDPVNRQRTVTNGTSTTLTLTSGTTYAVRVIAYNADGDGAASQSETGTPRYAKPGQVAGVSAEGQVQQLGVSWNAATNAGGYKVQWKSGTQDWSTGRQETISDANTRTHTITGLTAGIVHTVRVRATRAHADDGDWSDEATGTPKDPLPNQVTGVRVEDASVLHGSDWNVKLTVSWDLETNASGYYVQWKSGNQDWDETNRQNEVIGGTNISNTINLPDSGAGVMHTVQVRAKRTNADDGPWSDPATERAKKQSADPVTGLTLTPGLEHLAVSWTAPAAGPAPENYRVQWKSGTQEYTEDPDEKRHAVVAATETSHTIQGLVGGREHTVRVRATIEYADDSTPVEAKGTPDAPRQTQQQGGTPGGPPSSPAPETPDDTCPDYPVGETAGGVERDRDPDTLVEFVQDARFGVESILSDETEESEAVTRLVSCFGVDGEVDGEWKSGSVYLFAITDERKYLLAPSGSGLEGTFLNLVDENGCDVAAELIRAAREEQLQCKDLGLLPDGEAAGSGFVQYLWDNPADPSDDSEPGYEDRGEAPGNSPKLSYIEGITDQDIVPGRMIILGSGYYPGWEPPGAGPSPPPGEPSAGDGGGCGVAGRGGGLRSAAASLLLAALLLAFAASRRKKASRDVKP